MKFFSGVWFAFALGSIIFIAFLLNRDMHIQAYCCAGVWLCAFRVLPCFTSGFLLFLAPFPFLLSPQTWVKGGLEVELLYGMAQMSPLYQIFRLFADPWSGAWAYVDSPFHYAVEGHVTSLASFSLFLLLVFMLISAFRYAKS